MLPSLGVKGPAVAVGIGFLALLSLGGAAYGVIAYIRNSLAIPAAVMENLSVRRAIRRSKELVAGHKARIFLLLLLLFALYLVAGVLQVPFAMLLLRSRSAEHVIGQFISVFVAFSLQLPDWTGGFDCAHASSILMNGSVKRRSISSF